MIRTFLPRRVREALEKKRQADEEAAQSNVVLPKKYREALALMKQQGRLQAEIMSQDTSAPEGRLVIERLRADHRRVSDDMEEYLKECGRIHAILNASDDYSLTIANLTPDTILKAIT